MFLRSSRLKVRENVLELTNVESWHDAVYQCVAENRLGMNVTSTWVEVQGELFRTEEWIARDSAIILNKTLSKTFHK